MAVLANIIDVSPLTLLVVLILALLILGPGKLPEVAGALGKSIREFRRTSSDIQDSISLSAPPAATAAAPTDAALATAAPAVVASPATSAAPGATVVAPPADTTPSAATPAEDPNEKIRMLEERLAALEKERAESDTNSPS